MKNALCIFFLWVFALGAKAQIQNFSVLYKLEVDQKTDSPVLKAMMMGAEIEFFFLHKASRMEMRANGMKMITLRDEEKGQGLMLMEMMGNKLASPMKGDEVYEDLPKAGDYRVEATKETKSIAGYTCTKYLLHKTNGETSEMWTTPAFMPKGKTQYSFQGLIGLPLELTTTENGTRVKLVAHKIDVQRPLSKWFDLEIPEGYQELTRAQLKAMRRNRN